jgi:hypothetical protein
LPHAHAFEDLTEMNICSGSIGKFHRSIQAARYVAYVHVHNVAFRYPTNCLKTFNIFFAEINYFLLKTAK